MEAYSGCEITVKNAGTGSVWAVLRIIVSAALRMGVVMHPSILKGYSLLPIISIPRLNLWQVLSFGAQT
jgi:hypothetical protein